MTLYKSEQAFSIEFIKELRRQAVLVQRIESHETGRGIPDIYTRLPEREAWIELKNTPYNSSTEITWKIPWRKGQQAWALTYRKATCFTQHTYTVCAFVDCCVVIPMVRLYSDNIIRGDQCKGFLTIQEAVYAIRSGLV